MSCQVHSKVANLCVYLKKFRNFSQKKIDTAKSPHQLSLDVW